MSSFDFIIAGGGASGLGLAYEISNSSLRGKKVLIVDRDAKEQNDRTWCFWTNGPTRLDHLTYRTWDRIEIINDNFQKKIDIGPYQYRMIRGIDYYRGLHEALSGVPNLTFRRGRVTETGDVEDNSLARVVIDGEPIQARWAFDSLFKINETPAIPRKYHHLKQHFKGWEIETPGDYFEPSTVTLFDFRTPQKGCMRFFYILPFTRRRALVEYTLFSANLLKPHEYDRALAEYIENILGIQKYRTVSTETGVIPMTDRPFNRRLSAHVMAIGTKGGMVKPSTGYAFLRMQRDARSIVHSLENFGDPFQVPVPPDRYRLYDSLMLQVMHRDGNRMAYIFTELFKQNPIQDIFRFLDEEASFSDNIRLISTLPKAPFLKALLKVKLLRKV